MSVFSRSVRTSFSTFHVESFIEGKSQQRLEAIFKYFEHFIVAVGPVIEDFQVRLTNFDNTQYKNIHRGDVEREWREDFNSVEKGLKGYDKDISFLEKGIVELNPHYGLIEFMRINGIPSSEIAVFAREVRRYWGKTYGKVHERLIKIHGLLVVMHQELEIQEKFLQGVKAETYFKGFERIEQANEHFQKERKAFYKIMELLVLKEKRVNEVVTMFFVQLKKVRLILEAQLRMGKSALLNDQQEIEKGVAAINGLIFLGGFISFYVNTWKSLAKLGLEFYVMPKLRKIQKVNQRVLTESHDYASQGIVESINGILTVTSSIK